jgi:hypothetical protein
MEGGGGGEREGMATPDAQRPQRCEDRQAGGEVKRRSGAVGPKLIWAAGERGAGRLNETERKAQRHGYRSILGEGRQTAIETMRRLAGLGSE